MQEQHKSFPLGPLTVLPEYETVSFGDRPIEISERFIRVLQLWKNELNRRVTHSQVEAAFRGSGGTGGTTAATIKWQLTKRLAHLEIPKDQFEICPAGKHKYRLQLGIDTTTQRVTAATSISHAPNQTKPPNSNLAELTYFAYRDQVVPDINTSEASRMLAARYRCTPIAIRDQVFPVTQLWHNDHDLISPDRVLGSMDYDSPMEPLDRSPTLAESQYGQAREFIKSEYTKGTIKDEYLEYCMSAIRFGKGLPKIDGRFGLYYDNILTQYAMEWELKKAVKEHGLSALSKGRSGLLPLREAVEEGGREPLIDGTGRCTAMTVSMLMVFMLPDKRLWTVFHMRSGAVGLSAGMLHVMPAGMFEVKNPLEKWSVVNAVKREMLEEVYGDQEQQVSQVGFGTTSDRTEPLPTLARLMRRKKAELSVTGICCDLLNLRPEICTVLFVPDISFIEARDIKINWEYETPERGKKFGTPWERIEAEIRKPATVGRAVPSGLACFELGRQWLRARHGI